MEKGLNEVYDGVKKLITISERIEENTKDIEGIKEDIEEISRERLDSLETGQKEIGADKNSDESHHIFTVQIFFHATGNREQLLGDLFS